MTLHQTKKSAALRLIVPKLNFKSSFDDTVKDVEMCFESISKLTELSEKLPISEITE